MELVHNVGKEATFWEDSASLLTPNAPISTKMLKYVWVATPATPFSTAFARSRKWIVSTRSKIATPTTKLTPASNATTDTI